MTSVRFHLLTALAALITSSTGAATYILLTGERHRLNLRGLAGDAPGGLLPTSSFGDEIGDGRCTLLLKRLATGGR